jgi:hypothetical protein
VADVLALAAVALTLAGCPAQEVRQHNEAVFGHFSSLAAANAYARRPKALGFQGLKVEDEGCGDWELEIDGADTARQRASFSREATKAGFHISFEQTGDPLSPPAGQVVGVIARKSTVTAANALVWTLVAHGWQFVDIVYSGGKWLVVMPQVPVKSALSIARELAKAGFHIQFQSAK